MPAERGRSRGQMPMGPGICRDPGDPQCSYIVQLYDSYNRMDALLVVAYGIGL